MTIPTSPTKASSARRFAILSAVLSLVFAGDAFFVTTGQSTALDKFLLLLFRDQAGGLVAPSWLTESARDMTSLGSYSVLTSIVVVVAGYLLIMRQSQETILLLVVSIGGAVLSNILKLLFDRPRPELLDTPAAFTSRFPSGHALTSAMIFIAIAA